MKTNLKKLILIFLFLISCEPATQITRPILDKEKGMETPYLIIEIGERATKDYLFYYSDLNAEDGMIFIFRLTHGQTDTIKLQVGNNEIITFDGNCHFYEDFYCEKNTIHRIGID